MTSQSEIHGWHCAARREIAERSEEAPAAGAAQPSENGGIWKAPKGQPVGVEVYDKLSGVVRGECRGGLGGAAAPNRPPSAARRAGGPSNRKREPPCPQGTQPSSQRTSPALLSLEALQRKFRHPAAQAAQAKTIIRPRARRAHKPHLKGQALLCFPLKPCSESFATPPRRRPKLNK